MGENGMRVCFQRQLPPVANRHDRENFPSELEKDKARIRTRMSTVSGSKLSNLYLKAIKLHSLFQKIHT